MPIYLSEKWGPQQPIKIEAEDIGDLTVIRITIDRRDMVTRALPEILSRLQAPLPERKPRGPNKAKAKDLPGNLPGQTSLPFPAGATPATTTAPPSSPLTPASAPPIASVLDLIPSPAPEKSPLHGVAIITRPGETMKKARERVMREMVEKAADAEKAAIIAAEPAVTA